jgi:quercetin dioxygenase-like cupin family protein
MGQVQGATRAEKALDQLTESNVVWIPPGQKHWHGASPGTAMTHIAITEHLDGKVVEWKEKVRDEQYGGVPSTR